MEKLNCEQAKQIDLVDYLQSLGHAPDKIRQADYWYLSPLRNERNPSFKVNRHLNVWYDHQLGQGGTVIDFAVLYFQCSVKEALEKLRTPPISRTALSSSLAGEKKETLTDGGKITVLDTQDIKDPLLCQYLFNREISLMIASRFCEQVRFDLYGKQHVAIGFKNNAGGYELRNAYFKGSSSPKQPTLISKGDEPSLVVFEGFFNWLSYQALLGATHPGMPISSAPSSASLILNSLAFADKSRQIMERFSTVTLYLDRDTAGMEKTKQLIQSSNFIDGSLLYQGSKDMNEHLITVKAIRHSPRQRQGIRR